MNISQERIAEEFIKIVHDYYPRAGKVVDFCYVKVIESYIRRLNKNLYHVGIYYPERMGVAVERHKDAFRDIAENMGLMDVVCINATRLIRDPMSKVKREDPRFWLELYWIAAHH